MSVVETRLSVWEALAGRAPGQPAGPADPGLWAAVVERLNPARAKPRLRAHIEEAELQSVRGVPYVMLRSPDDGGRTCYLRLSPEEVELAHLMDGTRTVARLVAEFVRICGRLAPEQVTRVVADLAANRMLEELPIDAFRPLDRVHRRPWPVRLGRGLLATAKGQRMVVANIDPLITFLYKAGGRILFTRVVAVLLGLTALVGLGLFAWVWWLGDPSVFLTNGSYATGALVLLGLNIVALGCHELGHALAAKHAGRRVPAAGFLVYFGIPSVFVDTTDVWMAGRKARLLTTISGPGAGLVLAGISQIVGFLVPELAPWTFKLSFAWYVNALFNLNPFLALDGYYLLMDWLEVPNLRARGIAWVAARLRRQPPRWRQLDREGRLVALYGVLAALWLVIAANIAYRIYADRVSGLITGLWRSGWPGRLLVVAVVAGLSAPVVYAVSGWLSRRWRTFRRWLGSRADEKDLPRRLDALRSSPLARLSDPALHSLAASANWVRPATGSQLVFAGAAQPDVYVVVDGALEARRPGDPAGTVRQRVGSGGVVGLANALTGSPSSLAWHTAGTTLLAVPANVVVSAIGPIRGPAPTDRAEIEELLAVTPAVAGLSEEDRLGLVARAQPVSLAPGAPATLTRAEDALVVASGVLVLPDGTELRRGTLVGPVGEEHAGAIATARTPARIWVLPALSGLPLLLGPVGSPAPPEARMRPTAGVHPVAGYPPLVVPPGPPPTVDDRTDRRFERMLWWLVILFLLFALFLTGTNFISGPVWAEMRADQALLRGERGTTVAIVDGRRVVLGRGDTVYVSEGDVVDVQRRSTASLTFRGGAQSTFCGGSSVDVGVLASAPDGRVTVPSAALALRGTAFAKTKSTSPAYEPLTLEVSSSGHTVVNEGDASYAVSGDFADVYYGVVHVDGVRVEPGVATIECVGEGDPGTPPIAGGGPTAGESPSDSPSPTPSPTPDPTSTPSPTGSPSTAPTTSRPTRSPTRPPTQGPPSSSVPPPPVDLPPRISWNTQNPGGRMDQIVNGQPCNNLPTTQSLSVVVTDDHDPLQSLIVLVRYGGVASQVPPRLMSLDGTIFYGLVGPFDHSLIPDAGGIVTVTVEAYDRRNKVPSTLAGSPVTLLKCSVPA